MFANGHDAEFLGICKFKGACMWVAQCRQEDSYASPHMLEQMRALASSLAESLSLCPFSHPHGVAWWSFKVNTADR